MTGRPTELTRNCLQSPNRGGAWYSSFALNIYCKIIVKAEDGRKIIIIRHANSVSFFTFESLGSNSKEYENIYNPIYTSNVSVHYLIFSDLQTLPLLSGPSINIETYCQRIYRNRLSNTPSSLLICYHKHFCRMFIVTW